MRSVQRVHQRKGCTRRQMCCSCTELATKESAGRVGSKIDSAAHSLRRVGGCNRITSNDFHSSDFRPLSHRDRSLGQLSNCCSSTAECATANLSTPYCLHRKYLLFAHVCMLLSLFLRELALAKSVSEFSSLSTKRFCLTFSSLFRAASLPFLNHCVSANRAYTELVRGCPYCLALFAPSPLLAAHPPRADCFS